MTPIDHIRTLFQRLASAVSRERRCPCGYTMPRSPYPRRAEEQGDGWRLRDVEETDAATLHTFQRFFTFRCVDCGETFEYEPVFATHTTTAFKE